MSDSQYRVQCKAVVTDLQGAITQLATSGNNAPVCHYSQPMSLPADGPHLACWYQGEQLERLNPTGSRLYDETYQIAYWEPDLSRDQDLIPDEDAQNDLQNLYRAVLDRFLVGTIQFPTGTSSNVMSAIVNQAAINPDGSPNGLDAFVRGFQVELVIRRWRTLT